MSNSPFDKEHARSYTERPPRQVPGFDSLHRTAGMLLAERTPANGRMLVLGAGGGLELKALAASHAGWSFDGVDPSAAMLDVARDTAAPYLDRMQLIEGYVDSAPDGPYDGATALLTFHFIPRAQRLQTLQQLFRRLKPGGVLLLAHLSFPQTEPARSHWLARHVAYPATADTAPEQLVAAQEMMKEALAAGTLTILAPEEEEAMLGEAGFENVALFYAGLGFRGWAAYKPRSA